MKILGIETSCDETSAAIVEINEKSNQIQLISNIISSSLPLHSKTGGIIPEVAAREQIRYILPVINKAMNNYSFSDIDKIAVTIGPGLIGSLLVGVETAKTFSFVLNKPLIPVNHLFGHIYANWIDFGEKIEFPIIALVVSGGHTDLILMRNHKNIKWLGGTRDDAAGEAFDKIGRLLGLPYPAGPKMEELAKSGKSTYNFPRPLINSDDFDFSFSGLKTAALREINSVKQLDEEIVKNICASVQEAIIDVLIEKTLKALKKYKAKSVLLGGGVAANQKLRDEFTSKTNIFVPQKSLCTDNAAMIAVAAIFSSNEIPWQKAEANPELYFD